MAGGQGRRAEDPVDSVCPVGHDPWLEFSKNVGTATAPVFAPAIRLQAAGQDIEMDQPQPTIDDVDGDGLPDLLVGTGCDLWYFRNQGSRTHPALSAGQPFLTVHDLPVRLPAYHMNWGGPPPRPLIQLADYNADGVLELITGDTGGDFLVHFGNTNHTDTIGPRVVRSYVPDARPAPSSGFASPWMSHFTPGRCSTRPMRSC